MSERPHLNSYARRHRGRLTAPLEPREQLLAASRLTFLGSKESTRGPRIPGEPAFIARKAAYRRWLIDVDPTPFPAAGEDFVVGVTDRRFLVWRTSKWWNLPAELAGSFTHEALNEVTASRMFVSGVLALRFRDGGQVLLESPRASRLRRLAEAYERATSV